MTGQELYQLYRDLFPDHSRPASWLDLSLRPIEQQVWLELAGVLAQGDEHRALLRKYGRHLPSCPTLGDCVCGFTEVERRW